MTAAVSNTSEYEQEMGLLFSQVGKPGSGAARYAAAMYFYQMRMLSAELLEIYRRCGKFDSEDPLDLARYEGVEIPAMLSDSDGQAKS